MIDVHITTIKHEDQRYNTVGDYLTDENGKTEIKISDLGDSRFEFLVAIHELVEVFLCKEAGISDHQIDAFDIEYDQKRGPEDITEPGDNPAAPYNRQHQIAKKIEKLICEEIGVSWEDYNEQAARLMKNRNLSS